jgi:hypothetical protein
MEVHSHDTTLCVEAVLRPSRVLDGEATDETLGLLEEVIRSIPYSEEVFVLGVPADGSNMLSSSLLIGESPDR